MTYPPGYLWSFPRPDHLAIGICTQTDAGLHRLREKTMALIRATGIVHRGVGVVSGGVSDTTLTSYSWPIPSLGRAIRSARRERTELALIGDAAGLVDPITREGTFRAAVGTVRRRGDPGGHRTGRSTVSRPRTNGNRRRPRARRPLQGELLPSALHRAADTRPRSQRGHPRGDGGSRRRRANQYWGLKCRLAKTLELSLAWRAPSSSTINGAKSFTHAR